MDSGLPTNSIILVLQFDNVVRISNTLIFGNITCVVQQVLSGNISIIIQQSTGNITSASTSNTSTIITIQLSTFTYPSSSSSYLNIILPTTLTLRNPATTKPFSIKISSYDSINNLIDSGVSYMTDTFLNPMSVTTFTISNKTSAINMDSSNYTFYVSISGDLVISDYINGSMIVLTLPS